LAHTAPEGPLACIPKLIYYKSLWIEDRQVDRSRRTGPDHGGRSPRYIAPRHGLGKVTIEAWKDISTRSPGDRGVSLWPDRI